MTVGLGLFKAVVSFLVTVFIGTLLWIVFTPVVETIMTQVNGSFTISTAGQGVLVMVHNVWLWFPILFIFAGILSLIVYSMEVERGGSIS